MILVVTILIGIYPEDHIKRSQRSDMWILTSTTHHPVHIDYYGMTKGLTI